MSTRKLKKQNITMVLLPILLFSFTACETTKPEPIKLNSDNCDNCGMTISNPKFAAELFTQKGRAYKFDDISCMVNYKIDNKDKASGASFFIADFLGDNHLISAETAVYITGENVKSPMGGNIAAFSNKESSTKYAADFMAEFTTWNDINK